MYIIGLAIGETELMLQHSRGYEVKTIAGLNGIGAKISTTNSRTGIGEAFAYGTISGVDIRVDGYILDNNDEAKEALRAHLKPLAEGTLKIYLQQSSGSLRPSVYRTIDFVVKTSPTITMEKHAKFSFTLFAPKPVFESPTITRVVLGNNTLTNMTVAGDAPCNYTLTVVPTVFPDKVELQLDGDSGKFISIDLSSITVTGTPHIDVFRDSSDKLHVQVDGTEYIELLDVNSNFMLLPNGAHTLKIILTNGSGAAYFEYKPVYYGIGVAVSGN